MHTCKICSAEISQLRRHLTIKHNIDIIDYLTSPSERIEFEKIEDCLQSTRRKNSPWCVEFYVSRGFTEEEAKVEIGKKRKNRKKPKCHPSTVEFYLKKGATIEDATAKVLEYKESIGKVPNKEDLVKNYGDVEGLQKWNDYRNKIVNRENTFLSKFNSISEGKIVRSLRKGFGDKKVCKINYDDFNEYANACRLITKLGLLLYKDKLDPLDNKLGREYGKNGYALDHKFSIYGGFYNKIDPFKIASYDNLRIISVAENAAKGQYCVIGTDEIISYPTLLDESCLTAETKEKIKNVFN